MKYHRYDPYRKEAEDTFWEGVKWAKDQHRVVGDKAESLRKRGHSIKAKQSRCKVKPVTLPKLSGDV